MGLGDRGEEVEEGGGCHENGAEQGVAQVVK